MTTPSPSEFLTFYRRLATHPSVRPSSLSRAQATMPAMSSRSFSVSVASPAAAQSGKKQGLSTDDSVKTGRYPDDQHATRQSSSENVMSSSVQQGIS